MPHSKSVLKTLLLSSVLATTLLVPTLATAETWCVTVLNLRSEDGIYRPAVRVVRGDTITFFRAEDAEAENPLTTDVIYNQASLKTWLLEAIPATANDVFDINLVNIDSCLAEQKNEPVPPVVEPPPPVVEPPPPVVEPPPPVVEPTPPVVEETKPETGYTTGYSEGYAAGYMAPASVQFAQASIADMDEAVRLAIYPTV